MFEHTIRVSLDEMVSWWIGINYSFEISTGKMGKYLKKFLPKKYWEMYEQTYSDCNYDNFWNSIFMTCELFRILSQEVAKQFSFTYPLMDDKNMTEFLKQVRHLPVDAKKITF